MGNKEKEIDFFKLWNPTHDVCVDLEHNIFSPIVPKSACTLMRHYVFFINEKIPHRNFVGNQAGQFRADDIAPIMRGYHNMDNMDCILFVRDPMERFMSGFSEVYYRRRMAEFFDMPSAKDITGTITPAGGRIKMKSDSEADLVKNSIEFEHKILEFLDTNRFNDIISWCTDHGRINVHVEPATDIIHWTRLQEYSKITFFEVDKNLYSNVAHWMRARGTPLKNEKEVFPNHIHLNGLKGFCKGAVSAYAQCNKGFINDLKNYYKKDFAAYELLKKKFYRGGEE